ncbi:MAG TPA: SIS domain-containing protein [Crenotrichaceae bacterium]|nr:SIS domain-containing protein [Crenotrichaceae bacterium]
MSDTDRQLQQLYPFLHGGVKETATEQVALLESVQQKAAHSVEVKQEFFAENAQQVIEVARAIAEVYRNNGRLFTMGNGGSSCDAAHVAVEFLHPVTAGRPALSAVNLVADTAVMTAVGNDVGFQHIYVRQLIAQAREGDGLIGISTSGNSDNLIEAFHTASNIGMLTIGLSGNDGGAMKSCDSIDYCLTVPTDSIHRIQETHVAIYHILWDLVHTLLADSRGGLG